MNFQEFYAGDLFSAYSFLGAHPLQEGFVFQVQRPGVPEIVVRRGQRRSVVPGSDKCSGFQG